MKTTTKKVIIIKGENKGTIAVISNDQKEEMSSDRIYELKNAKGQKIWNGQSAWFPQSFVKYRNPTKKIKGTCRKEENRRSFKMRIETFVKARKSDLQQLFNKANENDSFKTRFCNIVNYRNQMFGRLIAEKYKYPLSIAENLVICFLNEKQRELSKLLNK